MKQFALWLATTPPSVFIQEHNAWTIPAIQSIHIVGIALVMGSVLMIDLRILGWAWTDQTLRQTTSRFGPWLTGSLWLLLVTGLLMVIGEPVRELVTFSFWLKMALVAIGALVAVASSGRSAVTSSTGKPRSSTGVDQGHGDPHVPRLGLRHLPRPADRLRPRLGSWSPPARQ